MFAKKNTHTERVYIGQVFNHLMWTVGFFVFLLILHWASYSFRYQIHFDLFFSLFFLIFILFVFSNIADFILGNLGRNLKIFLTTSIGLFLTLLAFGYFGENLDRGRFPNYNFGRNDFSVDLRDIILLLLINLSVTITYYTRLEKKRWSLKRKLPETKPEAREENESKSIFDDAFDREFEKMPKNLIAQVGEFRKRARSLMRTARAVLICIVLVLAFAAFVVIFAGQIAEFGTVRIAPYLDFLEERNNREGEIRRYEGRLDNLNRQVTTIKNRLESGRFRRDGEKAQMERIVENYLAQIPLLSDRIKKKRSELSELNHEVYRSRIQIIKKMGDNNNSLDFNSNLIVATGITRFGIVIIAIYLVQILIHLYRYNTQAAAKYLSYADAIMLKEIDTSQIEAVQNLYSLDIGYGRAPTAIPSRAIDAFVAFLNKSIMRRDRRKKDSDTPSGKNPD